MSGFTPALQIASSAKANSVSSGSLELDRAIGEIVNGFFYLFYGEDELVEKLFLHLIVRFLVPHDKNRSPRVIYAVCGNYRVERTIIDIESLIRMIEASGMSPEEALKRVRVLTASSADQQAMLARATEEDLARGGVVLVLVRGIYKLRLDDARKRGRDRVAEEVQRSITQIKRACSSLGVPLVASAREIEALRMPRPEASSYLDHIANVIVYLRKREKSGIYNRAFLLKSPTRPLCSTEYRYEGFGNMGRVTPPIRMSFNDAVSRLRQEYREALVKPARKAAFDRLVETWSSELGAVTYAESVSLLDLMLLTAAVENRRLIEDLISKLSEFDRSKEK